MSVSKFTIFAFSLFLLTSIAYWPSLSAPFYLDDFSSIVNSNIVKYGSFEEIYKAYELRFIPYLTFHHNYQLGELDVTSFHIVNLLIHLVNSLLIFWVTVRLVEYCYPNYSSNNVYLVAVIASLIFALNPLNTQAVTYIVQRIASLAAFFYFLTIAFYIEMRLSKRTKAYALLFTVSFICALFSKQNTFTLFLIIPLLELLIIKRLTRQSWLLLVSSIILSLISLVLFFPELLTKLDQFTRETYSIERFTYFKHQLVILWAYVFKFFLPINLSLELPYSIGSFSFNLMILAGTAHSIMLLLAISFRNKQPLISFLIFFYYIASSIESSIIPIRDIAFEHRSYIPNLSLSIGVSLIISFILSKVSHSPIKKLITWSFISMLIISLAVLSYQRNLIWQDKEVFYLSELDRNPENTRVMSNLARFYVLNSEIDKAIPLFEKALAIQYQKQSLSQELLGNVITLYLESGKLQSAIGLIQIYEAQVADKRILSNWFYNFGVFYMKEGMPSNVEKMAKLAIKHNKDNANAYYLLSLSFAKEGRFENAINVIRIGLKVSPDNKQMQRLLNQLLAQ